MNNQAATRRSVRVCFPAAYQVELQETPIAAQPDPGQLLVKSLYSLISPGTELAMYTQTHIGFPDPTNTYAKYPFYPGYTAVGRVEATGSDVRDYAPGDVVFFPGHHQTYSLVSPNQTIVLAVPQSLPYSRVPFIRMAEISNTAVLMSDVRSGDTVVVLGLGLVGNLAAQLFQLQGARVIGVDLVPFRRELARQAGIEQTVAAEQQDVAAAVRELTGAEGPRIVVEATGSPKLVPPALAMAQEKGEVILLGSTRGTVELDVYNLIHRRGVSLKGAHGRLVPRHSTEGQVDLVAVDRQMAQLLDEGRLHVDHLVTEIVRPEESEVRRAYQALPGRERARYGHPDGLDVSEKESVMKLALHSVGYSGTWGGQATFSLEDFLRKAAQLGYPAVELAAKRPHASPLDLAADQLRSIRRILAEEGLEVVCMASYHDWSTPPLHPDMAYTEKELLYLREVVELAAALECPLVRTYTGFFHDGVPYRQQWDRCVDGLQQAARIAARHGVTLGVQNHSCIASHPDSLIDLVTDINETNVGIVLDAPMIVEHGLSLRETVLGVGKRMVHTHLTDFVRRTRYRYIPETVTYEEAGLEMVAVPVGLGGVDYREFLGALVEIGYQGALSYEMCSPLVGGGGEANLDRCARESFDYVQKVLQERERAPL